MKVDVVARFTNIWKTGVVVTALLATVVACGSSDASRARNVALVAGTSCTKPGQISKISKVAVVCGKTKTGNIWYPTMKSNGRSVSCTRTVAAVRKKKSVVWVCGVAKGKKLWFATSPLPPAVLQASAVVIPGVSEPVPVLESTDVATPSRPVVADNNVLANPTIADEPPITTPVTIAPVVTVPVTIATVPSAPAANPPVVTVPPANPPVVTAPVTAATCAKGGTCAIGETGPGGGKVFYLHASGTFTSPGSTCNTAGVGGISTCKYLEASPPTGTKFNIDLQRSWATAANQTTKVTGVTGTEIGTGYQNTSNIYAQLGNVAGTSAAVEARAYRGPNGLSDWFLPSQEELNELCKFARGQTTGNTAVKCSEDGGLNRDLFAFYSYWSSSESGNGEASSQFFGNGEQGKDNKGTNVFRVRPVRAF